MARKARISKFSNEAIKAALVCGEDQTDWPKVDAKTDTEIAADTAGDAAWNGVADDWFIRAQMASGPLVRPKENKRLVSVRYDADVVAFFKAQGRGWQARMNAVLRSFMESSR